jgi:hypothetical protein
MRNNTIEIILTSGKSIPAWRQRQLADWLTNTLQPVIVKQQLTTKKIILSSLKNSPAIYMS